MSLKDYVNFTELCKDDVVRVYITSEESEHPIKYLGLFKGIGNGDIVVLDTLRDYIDCNVKGQMLGLADNELIVFVEGNNERNNLLGNRV